MISDTDENTDSIFDDADFDVKINVEMNNESIIEEQHQPQIEHKQIMTIKQTPKNLSKLPVHPKKDLPKTDEAYPTIPNDKDFNSEFISKLKLKKLPILPKGTRYANQRSKKHNIEEKTEVKSQKKTRKPYVPCPSICDMCGQVYANPQALKSHVKFMHLNIRQHKCPLCVYQCHTSHALVVSIKISTLSTS